MTKERFISAMTRRGYKIEQLGRIVILRANGYRAYHFFNEDGTRDESQPPYWKVDRP